MKTYILVWDDFPKLDGLTKGDKQQDKCELIGCLSIFYKQYIPTLPLFVNYFHTIQNARHALLASKRRLIDLQKVPFKTLTNALLKSN